MPLDYSLPNAHRRPERKRTRELFQAACAQGDRFSCRIDAQLSDAPVQDAYRKVLADCRDGDLLSCRTLPRNGDVWLFPGEPGAMGRNPACLAADLNPSCNVIALRKECADGFPKACRDLYFLRAPDAERMEARSMELATVGCREGVVNECTTLDDADKSPVSRQWECNVGITCIQLGNYYRDAGLQELARDAYERNCQYSNRDDGGTCLDLAMGYLSERYMEPVPGRAQALLEYACKRFTPRDNSVLEFYPQCAAHLHQP